MTVFFGWTLPLVEVHSTFFKIIFPENSHYMRVRFSPTPFRCALSCVTEADLLTLSHIKVDPAEGQICSCSSPASAQSYIMLLSVCLLLSVFSLSGKTFTSYINKDNSVGRECFN